MPLYDYRCSACNRKFEALLDRWDQPAPPCPHCGAARAVRQLSVFAVGAAPSRAEESCGTQGCGPGGCACEPSSWN